MKFLLVPLILLSVISCNQNSGKPADNSTRNLEIDALKASPDNFRLLLENEHVRVLEYRLKPGERDNIHTHPPKSSYVVSGGKLKVHLDNGDSLTVEEEKGTASWMDYIGKHSVENTGGSEVKIILTEVKSPNDK